MNKTIVFFFAMLICCEVYSQDVPNPKLDSHRKFSEIKLGDNYEKWKDFLFDKEVYKDVVIYAFRSDNCCNEVFGNAVRFVWIIYQNDKIVSIRLTLKDFLEGMKMTTTPDLKAAIESSVINYDIINQKFSTLFGEPVASNTNNHNISNEPTLMKQWMGANTFLESQYNYSEAVFDLAGTVDPSTGMRKKFKEARAEIVVILSDLNYLNSDLKSQF